ncbi:MAG: hypothetical protein Q7T78_01215 [Rhodoferax sp.]|nr:hypothetical protein [Rhodoferax sp.]
MRIDIHVASLAIIELLRFTRLASAGTRPKCLALLYEQAVISLLPPRRLRAYPGITKLKVFKYQKNASQLLTDWHYA